MRKLDVNFKIKVNKIHQEAYQKYQNTNCPNHDVIPIDVGDDDSMNTIKMKVQEEFKERWKMKMEGDNTPCPTVTEIQTIGYNHDWLERRLRKNKKEDPINMETACKIIKRLHRFVDNMENSSCWDFRDDFIGWFKGNLKKRIKSDNIEKVFYTYLGDDDYMKYRKEKWYQKYFASFPAGIYGDYRMLIEFRHESWGERDDPEPYDSGDLSDSVIIFLNYEDDWYDMRKKAQEAFTIKWDSDQDSHGGWECPPIIHIESITVDPLGDHEPHDLEIYRDPITYED